ncbi:MAG TPA: ATP-binding protein [Sphingomicrobium sp.]|nr:ATP-binding protein [Sphingomicrobium sp.]
MPRDVSLAQAILDAIEEPTLLVASGRVEAANRPACSLLGGAIAGRDLRFAIRHPLGLDTILKEEPAEVELIGIGGSERPWTLSVQPVGANHQLVRLIDRSALRSAEQMRTDFVANASHELRTPLATIIGYAETLAEDGPVDDAMRARFGSTIDAEARRMLRIVEDLMSLSRIEADRYRPPDEQVDLGEVARIAIDNCVQLTERRGCRVALDVAPKLPAVTGDLGQLLQLTDNLIANALRYGCGDESCDVRLAVGIEGSRVVLEVSDQGEGIAADHLPRLTERFYRVDSARSRDSGGTGLGLAIVKHIVERHRGVLEIRSRPGEGTSVRVSFPAVTKA